MSYAADKQTNKQTDRQTDGLKPIPIVGMDNNVMANYQTAMQTLLIFMAILFFLHTCMYVCIKILIISKSIKKHVSHFKWLQSDRAIKDLGQGLF